METGPWIEYRVFGLCRNARNDIYKKYSAEGGVRMSQQMSLFAPAEVQNSQGSLQAMEGNALDEMFAASRHFRSSLEYLEMLRFIARFPKYSAFNGLLLFIQNPASKFVATAGTWRKRFNRYPKPGAQPLIILAPMSPVRFVFDVSDTEGDFIPPEIIHCLKDQTPLSKTAYNNTIHNCGISGIMVREIQFTDAAPETPIQTSHGPVEKYSGLDLDTRMNNLVLLRQDRSRQARYADLVFELAQIFCGHHGTHPSAWWRDRRNDSDIIREIEAESVAFLVCQRKGLFDISDKYLSRFGGADRNLPPSKLNAVITATTYIEDMGKSCWKKPKKQGRQDAG